MFYVPLDHRGMKLKINSYGKYTNMEIKQYTIELAMDHNEPGKKFKFSRMKQQWKHDRPKHHEPVLRGKVIVLNVHIRRE